MNEIIILPEGKMRYTDGCKYQLYEPITFYIPSLSTHKNIKLDFIELYDGYLTLLKGFAWDGASGPTIDTKSSMRGSAVHDALYKLIRQELLPASVKELADDILEFTCVEDGMWEWRAGAWHTGVDKLADAAADPRNKKKIKEAP